jgi:two-component system CheB/CheR fusion protein
MVTSGKRTNGDTQMTRKKKDCKQEADTQEESVDIQKDPQEKEGGESQEALRPLDEQGAEMETFPIVGIGASAGGLEAFEKFFANMPADSGMAFVLVQHLRAPHKSMLDSLVRRYTRMEVSEVKDGVEVLPNHAYIIPPGKDMALLHGKLHLMEPAEARGLHLPIDYFFRSLAQDQHERAICVVLSGTGSDGTLGLKAVKEEGGMAMVQDPQTAGYDGMPRSAIATGLVDYVLSPEEMPQQLITYVEHALGPGKKVSVPLPETTGSLQKIFILLRAQKRHDFSYYKQSTIRRRIERRMAVNQIGELNRYVRYLQENPLEVETLFRELLITVTNFFRDPEAFQALEEQVIPHLLGKPADQPIRVWVPGCATGEEAYSIAMLLRERMDLMKKSFRVQIFATDIDREAIETARAGVYPNGISADVSPERLARFFTQQNSAYHVNETIRDMLIFAEQNVIADPPFSKMDLISCRNLLIYMEPELQKKVLPLFHYSLRPAGFLFLGTSESVSELTDFFGTVDKKHKIFQRQETGLAYRPPMGFPTPPSIEEAAAMGVPEAVKRGKSISAREVAERSLLQYYAPACAIVNEKGEVLYFHGRTGKYLEPAAGKATLNILRMARQGLRLELTTALRKVRAQKNPVRYQGLEVKTNGEYQTINLTVRPVMEPPSMRGLLMVIFEDVALEEESEIIEAIAEPVEDKDRRIAQLERELRAKEEYLQTTNEELETTNEELKSTNEELQSSNEELQSTNEELETAKEEAQSVNEELMTVNAELREKINELSRANNDMNNLLVGTGVGTIFLDEELNIQRFTPAAAEVIHLIQTDVGRPVNHIASNLVGYDELAQDAHRVLDTLVPQEKEVQTKEGDWYLMRILPYRTLQNVIEGVVLTFVDITNLKQAERNIKAARDYAVSIVETVREPLVILDADLRVISANGSFYQAFQVEPEEVEGQLLYDLGNRQWDIPELREFLEEILLQKAVFNDYEVEHDFPDIGRRTMLLNAREVRRAEGEERLILLAIDDVTER